MYTQKRRDADTEIARFIDTKCQLIGGRIGVVAGLLVFIGTYAYGLLHFGVIVGITLGWLPCGLAAWITAIAVDVMATDIVRGSVFLAKKVMSRIRQFKLTM